MNRTGLYFLMLLSLTFFKYSHGQNTRIQVLGIGEKVNSPYDEQAPVLSPDQNSLYFTVSKHPQNTGGVKDLGDIWISKRDSAGNWDTPVRGGELLNNREYNAVIGFTHDGRTMYLIGHYLPGNKRPKSKGISVSYFNNGAWTFPQPVDIPYFENRSNTQSACLSYDGNIMMHAIESYNSRGAEDIYVSFRKADDTWTDVKNLGFDINTDFQEKTPYLAADNKTLFFSSNGLNGMGSMDLYMSKRLDDSWTKWSEPVNLGSPVNTRGRELYYFVIAGNDQAIFCSTQNSDGYGDIKYFQIMPEDVIEPVEETIIAMDNQIQETLEDESIIVVKGKIFDAENNDPLQAEVSFISYDEDKASTVRSDSATGDFQIELSSKSDFMIRVSAKGFMNVEESVQLNEFGQGLILKNYYLEPLNVGKVFKLKNVLFKRATSELIDSSYVELDMVFRMMEENPQINIELSGHTDNVGNARKNVQLSQERVEVVKEYLVDKGIDTERIIGRGYGGTMPVASNKTEETRRLNRRVEFKIIDSDTR